MRGKSHIRLGQYLIGHYMPSLPRRYSRAFLLGCVAPDRNPATYLKGSLRCQWLRGHNYPNARRFMAKIARRLEKKGRLGLWDYYTLGKLIHYTTDAFTYAHNEDFPPALRRHREYEARLQTHFLAYLQADPLVSPRRCGSVMETIARLHREYENQARCLHRDARFALNACCMVVLLLTGPIL